MKINDIKGINQTFAELPQLKKVHVLEDGRHFFNEQHAKEANGFTESKGEDGKVTKTAKEVKYKSLAPGAKELEEEKAA